MSNQDVPQTCAKCLEPVSSDAVFLKNGTYMCPACYQRFYGKKGEPGKSKNIFVSVEGIIAIVAVIGVFVLGYFIYDYVEKSRKEERKTAQAAEERAEALRKEEIAASEERARRAEESHRIDMDRQERLQKERIQAAAIADAKRAEELKLKKAEAERLKIEEEKKLAEFREKQKRDDAEAKARDAANAGRDTQDRNAEATKSRTTELAVLAKTLADAQRALAAAEAAKAEPARKSVAYKSLLKTAQDTKAALLAQYNGSVTRKPREDRDDIPQWRNAPATDTKKFGSGAVTITNDELPKLVAKFDAALKVIQTNEAALNAANDEMTKADAAIADAKSKLDDTNQRLLDLKATPAELAALGANPSVSSATGNNTASPGPGPLAPKPGTKVIQKKDGSQVRATSVMSMGDEVRYKDEDGKWQTLKKDEVEKIQ
ncbi:MAG TPA: hypothetical protein VKX17_21570 [Planctomycetota bacterium]|nr:hypothetical protein [Planctomycetota bacterium]